MGKTKLFDNWTWKRHLPEPFNTSAAKRIDIWSVHNTSTDKASTLHAPTLSAILSYMEIDENAAAKGAIGTNGSMIIAEYPSHRGETHICVFNKDTGKFIAGVFANISSPPEPYEIKADGMSGSALFFALIPVAMGDKEFLDEYNNLMKCRHDGYTDMEAAEKSAAILCDNLYRRIENADKITD